MKTHLVAPLALSAAAIVSASQPPAQNAPADRPHFRGATSELVVLPVTVVDRSGRYVSALPRDRFVVSDNGRRQDIELFSNEDMPVTVGLVIDDSGSMRARVAEVTAAALAFARQSNPADELFAIAFNDTVRDAVPDGTLTAANVAGLESALRSMVPEGRTALYNALVFAIEHVSGSTRPRRVIIVISDGGDNASSATFRDVLEKARASNVTIYTIGVFEDDDPERNPGVLKALSAATGGERFLPRSPGFLLQACERIARAIRSSYTIGYVPPEADGTYHRVRVDLQGADVQRMTVRTRPGYFASRAPDARR